ncbi:MAG TPA: Tex family protein [Prolixibacteraceae bacterium]|nr:Tex family protein [Prolixibacteraceae bacterium]
MLQNIIRLIAQQVGLNETQTGNTIKLLEEGATVPFIARYRKESTGSLDEVQIESVKSAKESMEELLKRKESILKTIQEQELLTPELKNRIDKCFDSTELEDIYLPYKPKRRTRAAIAKEKGLEPLAKIIMQQNEKDIDNRALAFTGDAVDSTEDALAGARDIIAEWVNENEKARAVVRRTFDAEAVISCKLVKGKEEEAAKYHDYFDWKETLKKCPSHRLLAMRRGENEGFLRVSVSPETDQAVDRLKRIFIHSNNACADQMELAVEDAYKRLLEPSIETEFANLSKEKADEEAIRVFAENMRQLLLAAPLGQKRVLAIDPGFRSGCKIVCLDAQGNLIHNETIYPHKPQEEVKQAARKLSSLVSSYQIEAVAIGNGTASRETEQFIKKIHFDRDIKVYVVSEDGASIYSASKIAREEFPEYDVTVRGAVSIGRRLMDPLAELVKIDPKSIGVGQYQHDVDQKKLKNSLDSVVESSVNLIGVNVNTASRHLLTYISGLGPLLAQNIVDYRRENGPFASRSELLKVPRMGAKAYEQSAGFLRIPDAVNPLDRTAVHPESYHVVEKMAKDLKCSLQELIANEELQKKIDLTKYITPKTGMPTLEDIRRELAKPGIDPRQGIKVFEFDPNIYKMEDIQVGMVLPGIVTNITKFGAFVDVGVKQDGLIHVSQMADRFISDPNEIVKLHQYVRVKVIELDLPRKRIQLSLKQVAQN